MTGTEARPRPIRNPVIAGQVWADNDPRSTGRTLRVVSVSPGFATCTVLTDVDGATDTSRTVGKTRRIMLDRFRPTSTGYRLIEDVVASTDVSQDTTDSTRGAASVRLVVDLTIVPADGQTTLDAAHQIRRSFVEHVVVPDGPFRQDFGTTQAELDAGAVRADGYEGPFVLDVGLTGHHIPRPVRASSAQRSGAHLIADERVRQIEVEGWTPDRDARLHRDELGEAAAGYLNSVLSWPLYKDSPPPTFPWTADGAWKPTGDPVRDLTKAGALIAAQIDRLLAEQA